MYHIRLSFLAQENLGVKNKNGVQWNLLEGVVYKKKQLPSGIELNITRAFTTGAILV
jgi:hypothetical protein